MGKTKDFEKDWKFTLRIFHEDGKIQKMKVANEYHAQNVLSLLFVFGDENAKNDIVFAELLGTKIFAWRHSKGITIRNATDDFLKECDEISPKGFEYLEKNIKERS
jgi:hypothetical protein